MTGLDVTRHVIVEIAALVTDGELEPLDDGIDLIVHQPPSALAEMDDFVRTMHTRSGLITEIEASSLGLADAGAQVIDYIRAQVPEAGTAPMCGNSICQDRRFLARWMPRLEAYLHYRNLDVSTLKELARRWRPEITKGLTKQGKHEALADIHESIDELKYYREHFLRV